MPLPYSRNTTYAPGDEVLSADLNAVQDAAAAGHAAMLGALLSGGQTAWAPAAGGAGIDFCPNTRVAVMASTPAANGNIVIQWAHGWGAASGTAATFTPISATGGSLPSVATNGAGGWVVGFSPSSASTTRIFYSINGGTSFTSAALTVSSSNTLTVEWDGSRFVAIDITTGQCWSSATGATWAAGTTIPAGLKTIGAGSFDSRMYATNGAGTIVGCTSTHLHRTTDGGAAWTQVAAIPGGTASGVTYDEQEGRFVYYSTTGAHWLDSSLVSVRSVTATFPANGPVSLAVAGACRGALVFLDSSIPNRSGALPPGSSVVASASLGASTRGMRVGRFGVVGTSGTNARFSGPLY